ncbi:MULTISPECIES: GNAT family N-acetyltransferase [Sphingomonas]|uniref:GNAT family N-acetyltransferase n=1 Tax=Sphingomonas TaxID=13687 RepID=UPI000DEFCBBC|nr:MULTISPECIES: GNAT family N-acetyltransferase [Sphingomonas]
MAITIHRGELAAPDVQALLDLHVAAMRGHSPADACHVLPATALDRPDILFLSAREDGRLLGVGALKALSPTEGEIKSMRTASAALRRGVAAALLRAIVAEACQRGYQRLLLETGTGPEFAAANALYDRAGFVETEAFGGYPPSPFTRFLALHL